jgi:predicted transposase/invertase (TIGR01784 family)
VNEFLDGERFWSILHQDFSSETEDKMMTIVQKLVEKGKAEGEARGIQQGIKRVALKLMEKGEKLETVSRLTDLSIEELKKLKDKQIH